MIAIVANGEVLSQRDGTGVSLGFNANVVYASGYHPPRPSNSPRAIAIDMTIDTTRRYAVTKLMLTRAEVIDLRFGDRTSAETEG